MTTTTTTLPLLLAALTWALPATAAAGGSPRGLHSLSYSPDSALLSAVWRDHAWVWDTRSGNVLLSLAGGALGDLQFTRDGKALIAFDQQTIELRDLASKSQRHITAPHVISAMTTSADGKSAIVTTRLPGGRGLDVIDLASGEVTRSLEVESVQSNDAIALSPDGKRVADGSGHLFDLESGAVLTSRGLTSPVLAWTLDGKKVYVADDSGAGRFVDAVEPGEDGRGAALVPRRRVLPQASTSTHPTAVLFVEEGRWLGLATMRGMEWWLRDDDLAPNRLTVDSSYKWNTTWTVRDALGEATDAVFSPDHQVFAVAGMRTDEAPEIHLLDAASTTGALIRTLKRPAPAPAVAAAKPAAKAEPAEAAINPAHKEAIERVSTEASAAAVWLGKLENPIQYRNELRYDTQVKMAISLASGCAPSVAEARKAGVPERTMIEFHRYEASVTSPLSLADIDVKVCQQMNQMAAAALKTRSRDLEARREPFLKVLGGDKAKLFLQYDMVNGVGYYFGRHKRPLRTPEDFRSSDVWYWSVHLTTHAYPEWKVEGFKFNGMTKTGAYEHTGPGSEPPASEFK